MTHSTPPGPGRLRSTDATAIADAVRQWSPELLDLSHSLHREPELGLAEHKSQAKLTELLTRAGFAIQSPAGGLETAFTARVGSGDLVIGLCAEYDALPGIGHACGHNVNGAASVGAAIALARLADELDITVTVIGTPAEETIGGKINLLDAGVFDDVAAAMMVHAGGTDLVGGTTTALSAWDVEYTGSPAHAASAPWRGVNALDAVALAHTAIGLLRQQLPPGVVVSLVVLEGGQAANVIPARARAKVEMRAQTLAELHELQPRIRACLEAGALASGTTLSVAEGPEFADLRQDAFMSTAYATALRALGREPADPQGPGRGSTDMGNVSAVIPSIHPTIGYEVHGAVPHTAEFAAHGATPSADRAVLDGARALAKVGVVLARDPRERARLLEHLAGRMPSALTGM